MGAPRRWAGVAVAAAVLAVAACDEDSSPGRIVRRIFPGQPSPAEPSQGAGPLLDFGDAPDDNPTGYAAGAPTGHFPARLSHDGARHASTASEWLGAGVDMEPDSKQVDRDAFDDGVVRLDLRPCSASTLEVAVSVRDRAAPDHPYDGAPAHLLYVNALFDWNRDGRWEGKDACAPEWAVQNVPIDVSAWPAGVTTRTVAIPFAAGAQREELWFRVTLTYGEPVNDWTGRGLFRFGETEDYFLRGGGPPPWTPTVPTPTPPPYTPTRTPQPFIFTTPGSEYFATATPTPMPTSTPDPSHFVLVCVPNPLEIEHGETGQLTLGLVEGPGQPEGWELEGRFGPSNSTDDVSIDPIGGYWPVFHTFTFRSTAVDGPERVEEFHVWVKARNRGHVQEEECVVKVHHSPPSAPPTPTPVPPPPTATPARKVTIEVVGTAQTPAGPTVTLSVSGLTPNGHFSKSLCGDGKCDSFELQADGDGRFTGTTDPLPPGRYRVTATDQATGGTGDTSFEIRSPTGGGAAPPTATPAPTATATPVKVLPTATPSRTLTPPLIKP